MELDHTHSPDTPIDCSQTFIQSAQINPNPPMFRKILILSSPNEFSTDPVSFL
jgi:hypothetical protein